MKIIVVFIVSLFLLTGCSQQDNSSNYTAEKTSYETDSSNNTSNNVANSPTPVPPGPEELFVYKTTIYTKTDARQNNVKLSCSQLNNVIVEAGSTFSFCDTLRTCQA